MDRSALGATVSVAVAASPVPPLVDVGASVVFTKAPLVCATTFISTTQGTGAGARKLLRRTPVSPVWKEPPPLSVTTNPPQLVVLINAGDPATMPAGKLSVRLTPERLRPAVGLCISNRKTAVWFRAMVVGVKDLLTTGGAYTFSVPDAVPPAPPSMEDTLPVVFTKAPALVALTMTDMVH